jgi:hypothetical protein
MDDRLRSTGGIRRLRLDRALGFWLGGAILGTAGCFVGASMPYRHLVAVTANVLWWGLFLGCLGASLGALLGLWAEQAGPPRHRRGCVTRADSSFAVDAQGNSSRLGAS